MKLKKYWCADVIRSDGKMVQYRLTLDLQMALNSDSRGRNEMQRALLVIPLTPYYDPKSSRSKDKSGVPPFGIGMVKQIYRMSANRAHHLQISRSQFIGYQYWSVRPFKICNTYLKHDYPWFSQKQIAADITYWQNRLFKAHVRPSRWWQWVTNLRIKRQLRRISRDAYRQQRRKWVL